MSASSAPANVSAAAAVNDKKQDEEEISEKSKDHSEEAAATANELAAGIAELTISKSTTQQEVEEVKATPDREGKQETLSEPSASSSVNAASSLPVSISSSLSSSVTGLSEFSLAGVAQLIQSGRLKNIIVLTGAGISVSAGIPDFRSKGTGLYDNLAKYNLPSPQAIFTLSYFRTNPHPFFLLARELYPTHFSPTPAHHFLTLLDQKGLLRRVYTQNIDGLELLADLPPDKLVQAHGGFSHSHCIECQTIISAEKTREEIFACRIPRCEVCGGLVKPKIVFFGESLPPRFHSLLTTDFPACDLLITMGTSLKVQPFASLIDYVTDSTPRLLINNEAVGLKTDIEDTEDVKMLEEQIKKAKKEGNHNLIRMLNVMLRQLSEAQKEGGFEFHLPSNKRDVFHEATCDEGVFELSRLLGWEEELKTRIQQGYKGKKSATQPEGENTRDAVESSSTPPQDGENKSQATDTSKL